MTRLGLALLLAFTACKTIPEVSDLQGAPERVLESEILEGSRSAPFALRKCLFVFNHSAETVSVFVDGRHAGWLGPRSSAGFYVGRGAGSKAQLRATSERGQWRATVQGPLWDVSWHLR